MLKICNSSSLQKEINAVIDGIVELIEAINLECDSYEDIFPRDARLGIALSADNDSKKIVTSYYSASARIVNLISDIEGKMSTVTSIMPRADRQLEYGILTDCDSILSAYSDFRFSLNSFFTKSEKAIRSDKESPSYAALLRHLSEFRYKTKLFSEQVKTFIK